jgi:hypothetical protein
MRFIFTALVAGFIAVSAGATTNPTNGLRGLVTRGPITPACVAEQPCTAPATGVTLVFSSNGRTVGRAITNAKGWYRITLRPGRYSVAIGSAQQSLRRLSPVRADVIADRYRRVDFSIDTGIR